MDKLLAYYGRLLLLRANPQDCPPSSVLQALLMAIYLLVSIVTSIPAWGVMLSVVRSLLDLAILVLFIHLLLRKRRTRVHQTLNALLGVGIVFGTLSGVLAFAFAGEVGSEEVASSPAGLLLFGLLLWLILVYGHILRQAIEVTLGGATLISFLYIIVSTFVVLKISSMLGFS